MLEVTVRKHLLILKNIWICHKMFLSLHKIYEDMKKYLSAIDEIQKRLDDLSPISALILDYNIRIQKMKFIMNPKFHLTTTKDRKTGNVYLETKVYWPDKCGVIKRLMTFSLGNMINYPLGSKHPDTVKAARKEIQEKLIKKFMIDILLHGIDNETRMQLLPKEQEMIKEWEVNGTLLAQYIKEDAAGIYLVIKADDKADADKKLSTLPYYPYMKIEIMTLR